MIKLYKTEWQNQFEKSENNIYLIFDKYHDLSKFSICRDIVQQKQKELESYGYCI